MRDNDGLARAETRPGRGMVRNITTFFQITVVGFVSRTQKKDNTVFLEESLGIVFLLTGGWIHAKRLGLGARFRTKESSQVCITRTLYGVISLVF